MKNKFPPSAIAEAAAQENRTDARFQQCAAGDALAIARRVEIFKCASGFIPATEI